MKLVFVIPGPPVPKERARVVTREVSPGVRKTRGITPKRTEAYEKHVGLCALAARMYGRPWPHASADARFGLTIAIKYSGQGGDGDNYFKAIADACNGVLWVDDRQIDDGRWIKVKVERGQERAEVEAWVL